jgi:hypothetical protein
MPRAWMRAAGWRSRYRIRRSAESAQRTGTGAGKGCAGAAGAADAAGAAAVCGVSLAMCSPCLMAHCPASSSWRPVQFMARPKAEVASSAALPTAAPARSVRVGSAGAAAGAAAVAGAAACGAAAAGAGAGAAACGAVTAGACAGTTTCGAAATGAPLAAGAPGAVAGGRLCAKLAPLRPNRNAKIQ